MLERQPPLPKTTLVRIVGHEKNLNQEQALVHVMPYGEESSCSQSKEGLDWPQNALVVMKVNSTWT